MKITYLELEGFLPYEHETIDFTTAPQIAIVGDNGHGKSSLLDAILWCLYGEGRSSADKMIHHGDDMARVSVDAQVGSHFMQVSRTRRLNRDTQLSLVVDGVDETKHTIAETEERIERLIGMTHDALLAGPFMVQNRSDELMRVPASERKDLLAHLFGLDVYDLYHREAKDRWVDAQNEQQRNEGKIESLESAIAVRPSLDQALAKAKAEVGSHQQVVDEAEDEVNRLREEAAVLVERERQLTSVDELVSAITGQLDSLQRERKSRTALAGQLTAQSQVVGLVPCGAQGIYATCALLEQALKAKDQLTEISFDDIDQQFDRLSVQLSTAQKQRQRLSEDADRITECAEELRAAGIRLAQARMQADELKSDIASLEANLASILDAEERLKDARKELARATEQAAGYEIVTRAFHRNGIPTMILEQGLPLIEQEANRILARMPGNLSIQLVTQRETKAKTIKETLDVLVDAAGRTLDYELLSGGERFRVDFAVRLAVSAVLSQRSGSPIDTLWLDEGWGSQDADGREAMLEAIATVSGRFGLIVVVSHVSEVTDRFPVRLEVSKDGGVSHAQLVA